jgi:hypothetical protein
VVRCVNLPRPAFTGSALHFGLLSMPEDDVELLSASVSQAVLVKLLLNAPDVVEKSTPTVVQ